MHLITVGEIMFGFALYLVVWPATCVEVGDPFQKRLNVASCIVF